MNPMNDAVSLSTRVPSIRSAGLSVQDRRHSHWAWRLIPSACLAGLLITVSSCGLLSSPRPSGLAATPVGPTLEKLWRAHGGTEAWRRHGKVRAQMVVAGDPPGRELEKTISFCIEDWSGMEVGKDGVMRDLDLTHQHTHFDLQDPRSIEDYHFRAARFFFHLPLALSQTGWNFRLDVFDERDPTPNQFWAMPSDMQCPHLGYYLFVNPDSGLLDRVIYQVGHSRFAGRIFSVEFKDYRWINGVQIATTMLHREAAASRRPTTGMPVPSSAGRGGPSMASWTLRFNAITFEEAVCEEEAEAEVPAT
jgi:hypothetical protein